MKQAPRCWRTWGDDRTAPVQSHDGSSTDTGNEPEPGQRRAQVKTVAILLVSVVVIGLILWVCFFPPPRMPDYVIGDEKCDLCGEQAVYSLRMEGRYLLGEYCRTHRWFGMVHASPWSTVTKVLLGAAVFGVIYSVLSLLPGPRKQGPDGGLETGDRAP
jgi:hypothetical protein